LPEAFGKTEGHVQLRQTIGLPPKGFEVSIWVNVRDFRGSLSNSLRASTSWN
jgi:hypothetical protein